MTPGGGQPLDLYLQQLHTGAGDFGKAVSSVQGGGGGTIDTNMPSGMGGYQLTQVGTDVALRIDYNSTTMVFSTYFNNGSGFQPLASYGVNGSGGNYQPTGWNLGSAAPFMVQIMGVGQAGASGGFSISEGTVYADNFSVSAIPEPSTYAAMFGVLAVGFAAWRRRRTAA